MVDSRVQVGGGDSLGEQICSASSSVHGDPSLREELQDMRLMFAERLRYSETLRLEVEGKLEALETTYSELLDAYRLDMRELSGRLIESKDFVQRLLVASADVEKELALATAQCRVFEVERGHLVSRIEELQMDLSSMGSTHASTLERYEQELKSNALQFAELLAQRDALEAERHEIRQQAELRSSEVDRLQAALTSALTCLESTLENDKQSAQALRFQCETLELNNAQGAEQLFENDRRISELNLVLQAASERIETRLLSDKQLIESLLLKHEALSAEKAQLEKLCVEHKLQVQQLQESIQVLNKRSESDRIKGERAQEELLEKLVALRSELSLMTEKVDVSTVTIASVQAEVERYRRALVSSEQKVEALQRSAPYLLGVELIKATRSVKSFFKLPVTLFRIKRRARLAGAATLGVPSLSASKVADWLAALTEIFAAQGIKGAEKFVRERASGNAELANALVQLAKLCVRSDPEEALRLGRESVQLAPRGYRSKWLAFLLFDAGNITEADELLRTLPKEEKLTPSQRYRSSYIEGCNRLFSNGLILPAALEAPLIEVLPGSVFYVASSSMPYHVSGYTTRTHSVLQSIQSQGWRVHCVTRPGYPDDRTDSLVESRNELQHLDGVVYEVLPGPHRRKEPLDEYLLKAAEIIEAKARELRPAVIHAASNYEAALPALIAARRLGIPFVYEVRGLWEFTSASKKPGWETTERFALDRQLETLVAKNADRVLTLTGALRLEMAARGVLLDNIHLAPNAIDPEIFLPVTRDTELASLYGLEGSPFVVGYIGSVLVYEGLDDLLKAFAMLRDTIPDAKLLIVGDGDAMGMLKALAQQLRIEEAIVFTGKVVHTAVQRHFGLLDVVALPRKPYKVCELVSPLKPLEAMAMGVPLVVSDVAALKEMVREGETALVHKAADVSSLTNSLLLLAGDPALRVRLANAAREDVLDGRTWSHVGSEICRHYLALRPQDPTIGLGCGFGGGIETGAASPVMPATMMQIQSSTEPVELPLGKNAMTSEQKQLFDQRLVAAVNLGSAPLLELVARQGDGRSAKFVAFCQVKGANHLLANGYVAEAVALAEQAVVNDPGITTLRGAARICYNAANLEKAVELVERIAQCPQKNEKDDYFIDEVKGRARLAEWVCAPAAPRSLPVQPKRVLNVLAFSLPYTSVGYATRSHGLAQGIKRAGWDIRPYTRPGFPYDFKSELEGQALPLHDEIDGITYRRLFDIKRSGMNEVEYLFDAIKHFERVIEEEQPEVVHAASNYVTALPALIAARRKGVPFVYEVRGFWEVTRSSRDENFVHTGKYRFMQMFEGLVARQADSVITITTAMREELVERGVAAERISVAYNSVDPERFMPRAKNHELAIRLGIPQGVPVIGYIGSFVDYEGLDDLISAAAGLKCKGYDFRLLMVGDGAVFESLSEQVDGVGLQDQVLLTGRVPHDEVEDYYSLIDIAPFPRKPWEVCELVSPLKPFEAMALQKAVIVSGTRALVEIVRDGYNGLVFEKGNEASLQSALERLIVDVDLRRQLGANARSWIIEERSWDVAGEVCARAYGAL